MADPLIAARTACKGLVELIVLNIGLNARILNPQIFAMFVFMALYARPSPKNLDSLSRFTAPSTGSLHSRRPRSP